MILLQVTRHVSYVLAKVEFTRLLTNKSWQSPDLCQ